MTSRAQQEEKVKTVCANYRAIPDIPLAQKQRGTARDAPPRGSVWISRTSFRAPLESDLRDALWMASERLRTENQATTKQGYPPLKDVGVELISPRHGADATAAEPSIPETQKVKTLQESCESDVTILYMHGGGM